jgi:hypothetical protein
MAHVESNEKPSGKHLRLPRFKFSQFKPLRCISEGLHGEILNIPFCQSHHRRTFVFKYFLVRVDADEQLIPKPAGLQHSPGVSC